MQDGIAAESKYKMMRIRGLLRVDANLQLDTDLGKMEFKEVESCVFQRISCKRKEERKSE